MTTADEENEVQENVASSCVVLPGRLNMLGEYEQWKYVLNTFVFVISYCFSPTLKLPCYSQSRHQLFRQ